MLLEVAETSGSTICCRIHKSYKRVDRSMIMKPMDWQSVMGGMNAKNPHKHQGRATARLKVGRTVQGMTSPPGAGQTRLAL